AARARPPRGALRTHAGDGAARARRRRGAAAGARRDGRRTGGRRSGPTGRRGPLEPLSAQVVGPFVPVDAVVVVVAVAEAADVGELDPQPGAVDAQVGAGGVRVERAGHGDAGAVELGLVLLYERLRDPLVGVADPGPHEGRDPPALLLGEVADEGALRLRVPVAAPGADADVVDRADPRGGERVLAQALDQGRERLGLGQHGPQPPAIGLEVHRVDAG